MAMHSDVPQTRQVETADARRLRVELAGDGRCVVVVHVGTPNAGVLYERWVKDAARRDLTLITYDRPGYGGSSAQLDGSSRILVFIVEGPADDPIRIDPGGAAAAESIADDPSQELAIDGAIAALVEAEMAGGKGEELAFAGADQAVRVIRAPGGGGPWSAWRAEGYEEYVKVKDRFGRRGMLPRRLRERIAGGR